MHRRTLLLSLAGWPSVSALALPAHAADSNERLNFPADFGAHPKTRTEWWYVTGSLRSGARLWGFQVTFFRSSTGIAQEPSVEHRGALATDHAIDHATDHVADHASAPPASRFAPTQLVFAHAALTDLEQMRLRHDQRISRSGFNIARAETGDTNVTLRDWRMTREPLPTQPDRSRYLARVASDSAGFAFELQFDTTQPVLLQGQDGVSQKGPSSDQVSHYYSQPQLAVHGALTLDGKLIDVTGRGWLDHEWSDAFIAPQAVGWDWIGMNLDDGSALTAFRLRRADGSALYAGGSFRAASDNADRKPRNFASDEVRFTPMRIWESAGSRARYPVQWTVDTPVGRFGVNALMDNQELDSRGSTGSIYWEGLSELLDSTGRRVGRGYLEMTGYAAALRI
jgi:predicted secreted hydrolase